MFTAVTDTRRQNQPGPIYAAPTGAALTSDKWSSEVEKQPLLTMAAALPVCYHGAITKDECEALLAQKNRDGAYLIRDSETIQGAMCLCVYKKKVVYTYRILQNLSGHYTLLAAGGLEETFFKSLDDLIHHYKRKNQGLAMHLRRSIKRKRALLIQPQRMLERPPAQRHPEPRPPDRMPRDQRPPDRMPPEPKAPDQRPPDRRPPDPRSRAGSSSRVVPSLPDDDDHDYENVSQSDYVEVLPD